MKNIFVQKALEEPTEAEREAAFEEATAPDFDRKLKEMKLAIGLEKRYTKNEILNAYLNIAGFGDNTYGIQAAAQHYYSVNAKDLTLAQAASLIAIVQYPGERGLDNPENYAGATRSVATSSSTRCSTSTTSPRSEYDEAIADPGRRDHDPLRSRRRTDASAPTPYAKWFCDYIVKNVQNFPHSARPRRSAKRTGRSAATSSTRRLDLDLQITAQQRSGTRSATTTR